MYHMCYRLRCKSNSLLLDFDIVNFYVILLVIYILDDFYGLTTPAAWNRCSFSFKTARYHAPDQSSESKNQKAF